MPVWYERPSVSLGAVRKGKEAEMINVRNAFAGVLAGLVAMFALSGSADAAPAVKPSGKVAKSICETGYRGQPAYDRKCLKTGTFRDGAMMWLETDRRDRREICKTAKRFGGILPAVRETFNDVAYDTYRNHKIVLMYAGLVAQIDCRSMGYRV